MTNIKTAQELWDMTSDDSVSLADFHEYLISSTVGLYLDAINTRENIQEYVKECISGSINVAHILKALEDNSSTDIFNIWLGNSMNTPKPIETKEAMAMLTGLVAPAKEEVSLKDVQLYQHKRKHTIAAIERMFMACPKVRLKGHGHDPSVKLEVGNRLSGIARYIQEHGRTCCWALIRDRYGKEHFYTSVDTAQIIVANRWYFDAINIVHIEKNMGYKFIVDPFNPPDR